MQISCVFSQWGKVKTCNEIGQERPPDTILDIVVMERAQVSNIFRQWDQKAGDASSGKLPFIGVTCGRDSVSFFTDNDTTGYSPVYMYARISARGAKAPNV